MEFLSCKRIREQKVRIQDEFDRLMATEILVARPGARQWRFFRACCGILLENLSDQDKEFDSLARTTAAQYKFEVENKLSRYYQRPGSRHDFVFVLAHASRLGWYGLSGEDYPCLAGYGVLVREMTGETDALAGCVVGPQLEAYLERVIAEGMAAELRAYMSLPDADLSGLAAWFVKDSPAMREIVNVVKRCGSRGWTLQSPMNPSTCRLLAVAVKKVSGSDAEVAAREYWYLRWWDRHTRKYTYPYRETNQQVYILKKIDNRWLIYQNMRPAPRSSQPLRWKRSR